jgi:hypothetical protein
MASVDTGAIEGEIDRIRSLGLEELRREWRRLYHSEPSLRSARLNARQTTGPLGPFLSTRPVHSQAAIWHNLSPPLTPTRIPAFLDLIHVSRFCTHFP